MRERGIYGGRGCGRCGTFSGVEEAGSGVRVGVGLAVISLVVLSGLLLVVAAPEMWWVVTIYGWVVFPAMGLISGGSRSSTGMMREAKPPGGVVSGRIAESPERQLLGAMERSGAITPARAAIRTTLSVAQAEELLAGLAREGYIEVRVRNGGLFYSMWDEQDEAQEIT